MVRFLAGERFSLIQECPDRLWAPPIFEWIAGSFPLAKAVGSGSDLR